MLGVEAPAGVHPYLVDFESGTVPEGFTSLLRISSLVDDFEGASVTGYDRNKYLLSKVDKELWAEYSVHLRDKCDFEHCSLVTAVDWGEDYEVVYHLTSYYHRTVLAVHIRLPKDDPTLPTASKTWGGANYHERECFDMMGVIFEGHPNHERILQPRDLPEDFFPLRKDFHYEGEWEHYE